MKLDEFMKTIKLLRYGYHINCGSMNSAISTIIRMMMNCRTPIWHAVDQNKIHLLQ